MQIENIAEAIEQHARAKRVRLQAEKQEKAAREVILDFYKSNPEEFSITKADDDEVQEITITRGDFRAAITVPHSDVPEHVPADRVYECREEMLDTFGSDYGLFGITYSLDLEYVFKRMEEAVRRPDTRQDDIDGWKRVLALIEKYTQPAERKELAARVSSKEVKGK